MKYDFIIRGIIGSWWSGTTAEDVRRFLSCHQNDALDIAICSPGGNVAEGLDIYQALKDHGKVKAHIIGMTASMATIIAMGAQSVDMVKGSLILVHNASIGVDIYKSLNKKQLQSVIDSLQKSKTDLNTIDDLLASIYADKTGRSVAECRQKMESAVWINPEDALSFGFIDSIRDDAAAAKATAVAMTQFSNSIIKDFGLPALPSARELQSAEDSVADAEGNPTKSFIQKTWDALKDLVLNHHAQTSINSMKKTFANICAILGFAEMEVKDNYISLSADDVQKVEDNIAELNDKVADITRAKQDADAQIADLQTQLDNANAQLAESRSQIENLQASPAQQPTNKPADGESMSAAETSRALFNAFKQQF